MDLGIFAVILAIILLVVVITFIVLSPDSDDPGNPKNVTKNTSGKLVDYGNGLYYFPETKSKFGNSLTQFIEDNPKLKLVSMTSNNTGLHGYTEGYFAYFEKK